MATDSADRAKDLTQEEGVPLDPLATTQEGASSVLEGVSPPAVEEVEGGVDNPAFPRDDEEEGVDLDHPDAAPTPTVVAAAPVAVPAQEESKAAR